jgi:hypothetical protein
MVREQEAARLRQQMAAELDGEWSLFFRCVAGIIVLVTLVIISPTLGLERDGAPQAIAATKSAPR